MIVVSRVERQHTWDIRIEHPRTQISTSCNVCGLSLRYQSWTYDDDQESMAIAKYKDLIKRNYTWKSTSKPKSIS